MVAALLGIASKLGWMAITALAAIVGAKYGPQAAQAVHDAWHGKGESITEEQAQQILAAYRENEAEIARNMAENLSFGVARPRTGDADDAFIDLLGWPEKEPEGATNAVDSGEFYDPDETRAAERKYGTEAEMRLEEDLDLSGISLRQFVVEKIASMPPRDKCQWLRDNARQVEGSRRAALRARKGIVMSGPGVPDEAIRFFGMRASAQELIGLFQALARIWGCYGPGNPPATPA